MTVMIRRRSRGVGGSFRISKATSTRASASARCCRRLVPSPLLMMPGLVQSGKQHPWRAHAECPHAANASPSRVEHAGAKTRGLCSIKRVDAACRDARAHQASLSPSDFSFLTDLDEDSSSASLLFDVGATGSLAIRARGLQVCLQGTTNPAPPCAAHWQPLLNPASRSSPCLRVASCRLGRKHGMPQDPGAVTE